MRPLAATLLLVTTLAACGYTPSSAECFSFAETKSPCSFTPVATAPGGGPHDRLD